MADKVGEMYFALRADVKTLKRDLKNVQNHTNKEAKKMGTSFGMIFAKAAAAAYAFKKAFDFAAQFKNAARDAQEMRNKFLTVFESIQKEAKNTAKTFAKSFGVAVSTAQELIGATGDLLVGFGFSERSALGLSKQVNELAQDLASFTNFAGGAKGASQALTKAILGETESVKALGIVLRQNTKEFKQQMSIVMRSQGVNENQARAIVLLEEAYKQSGKAVGDYARTMNDLANTERRVAEQWKTMNEIIGKTLVPSFEFLTTAASGFLTVLKGILETGRLMGSMGGGEYIVPEDAKQAYYDSVKGLTGGNLQAEYDRVLKYQKESQKLYENMLSYEQKLLGHGKELSQKQRQRKKELEAENALYTEQYRIISDIVTKNDEALAKYGHGGGGGSSAPNAPSTNVAAGDITWIDPFLGNESDQLKMLNYDFAKPLIESGEEFENSMAGSLSTGQDLVNLLSMGLGAAAGGFLSTMSQAFSLTQTILSVVAGVANIASGGFGSLIPSFAEGGSFTVPQGYPNDSFPMMVQSGEHVEVTSSSQTSDMSDKLDGVIGAIQAMNANLVNKNMNPLVNIGVDGDSITKGITSNQNRMERNGVNTNDL